MEPGRTTIDDQAHRSRPGGVAAVCHARKNLAARQGRSARSSEPRGRRIAGLRPWPCAPTQGQAEISSCRTDDLNVTPFAPTQSSRGNDFRPFSARSGAGWNRGTWQVPNIGQVNHLNILMKSESGTMEPWNRISHIRARAGMWARRSWFHGSMVPRGIIHKCFEWVSLGFAAVPARFHGSSDICGGQNGQAGR